MTNPLFASWKSINKCANQFHHQSPSFFYQVTSFFLILFVFYLLNLCDIFITDWLKWTVIINARQNESSSEKVTNTESPRWKCTHKSCMWLSPIHNEVLPGEGGHWALKQPPDKFSLSCSFSLFIHTHSLSQTHTHTAEKVVQNGVIISGLVICSWKQSELPWPEWEEQPVIKSDIRKPANQS